MTQINHPSYYNSGGIETADFIDAHCLNFNRGNIVKYVVRAGKKDGEDALTALLKAQWYLGREIVRTGHEQARIDALLRLHPEPEDDEDKPRTERISPC